MQRNATTRFIAVIIAMAMIFTIFTAVTGIGALQADAASEVTVNQSATIKNGPLNVRSGPGTGYKKVGTVAKGKTIKVLTKTTNSKGEVWYKYQYSSSKKGYVLAKYVTLKSSYTLKTLKRKATIKNGPLNVRSGPGTGYSVLGTVKKGATISVKKKATLKSGAVWYQFSYNGKTGYVLAKYVKLTNIVSETSMNRKAVVNANTLAVRSGPGSSNSKLGTLSKNKEIYVNQVVTLASGKKWYRFKYNSKTAYVSGDYLKITEIIEESSFEKSATIKDGPLNVRSGPGTGYSKLGTIAKNKTVSLLKKIETTSGTWYTYQYSKSKVGYLSGTYLSISYADGSNLTSEQFETWMTKQGFPSSYKSYLRTLHNAHPEWIFKAYQVGTSWSNAVSKEMSNPYANVVYKTSPTSYRSDDAAVKNNPVEGGWYAANEKVVKYYMDPRNFLNENYIYQFMVQTYDGTTQNANTVASVVKGTFMETRSTGNSTYPTFAKLINAVGKETGINPNVLAAMIRQEQGVNGTSSLISGTYSGYKGYYNFFNVKATGSTTAAVIVNGLKYAKEQGWNTIYKSIKGGAEFYGTNYVLKNQDTFYTKKFNIKNGVSNIGQHQYMTNVAGGASEGKLLKQALSEDDYIMVFEIPVYNSMPSSACKLPS